SSACLDACTVAADIKAQGSVWLFASASWNFITEGFGPSPSLVRDPNSASVCQLVPADGLQHFSERRYPEVARPGSIEEAIGALVKLKNQGKIRHIGVSNFDVSQIQRAL